MKYYCHVCVGAPNCYTEFLDKLQNCQNGTSSSHSYYFGRCSNELFQLVPLPCSQGRSTSYYDRLHDFSVTS